MRKVSQVTCRAFLDKRKAHVSNTQSSGDTLSLHGNAIAQWYNGRISISLARWPTRTTMDRLNTLLTLHGSRFRICQKDYLTYIWDTQQNKALKPMNSAAWYDLYHDDVLMAAPY